MKQAILLILFGAVMALPMALIWNPDLVPDELFTKLFGWWLFLIVITLAFGARVWRASRYSLWRFYMYHNLTRRWWL